MISFHSLHVAPKQDYLRSIHFHSFPFLYFKTSNQGCLIPFHSILFPYLNTFHSIHFYSLMIIPFHSLMNSQMELQGPFGWRSGKVGGWKSSGRMEKWKDKKYLIFLRVCLVGGMEKWKDGKLFCLVEKKSGRIENVVYIN